MTEKALKKIMKGGKKNNSGKRRGRHTKAELGEQSSWLAECRETKTINLSSLGSFEGLQCFVWTLITQF